MLTDLVERFIREVCAGRHNETAGAYRTKLKYLITYAKGERLNQDLVDKFKIYLLELTEKRRGGRVIHEPLSPWSIRSILQTTAHFLRWGAERNFWPELRLENIREPAAQPKAIDQFIFLRLMKAAACVGAEWERVRNTAILCVLRDSGARVGAVASIDMSDVDLVHGVMSSITKGGKRIWIYMSEPTVQAVSAWLEIRQAMDPWDYRLWTGQKHRGISRHGIYQMIRRLAVAAGIKGARINPHSFRHAFARDALRAGADLSQVSMLLHHVSIVVTAKYYARWDDKELRDIHRRVSPMREIVTAKP